jgi:hypothetical protein
MNDSERIANLESRVAELEAILFHTRKPMRIGGQRVVPQCWKLALLLIGANHAASELKARSETAILSAMSTRFY